MFVSADSTCLVSGSARPDLTDLLQAFHKTIENSPSKSLENKNTALYELQIFTNQSYNSGHYALNRRLMKATSKFRISESQSNSKNVELILQNYQEILKNHKNEIKDLNYRNINTTVIIRVIMLKSYKNL